MFKRVDRAQWESSCHISLRKILFEEEKDVI